MLSLLTGAVVSLLFTLFLTPLFIRLFHRLQWGQFIRDDGPVTHHAKRGTATMGGVVILLAAVVGYFLGHLVGGKANPITVSGLLVLLLTVGLGLVGFVDDLLKTRHQRSLGLGGWAKILGQVVVATLFAVLALQFPKPGVRADGARFVSTPASTRVSIVRDQWFDGSVLDFRTLGVIAGAIVFIVWIWIIVTSTSNGVNVADGLDGLATGASIFAIGSYVIIGFWQYNQTCYDRTLVENTSLCYDVRDPLDLAIVAACITGALVGFLWWNTSPAQIFMGDTGSLGLGGALGALAVLSHTELLLVFVGGLFVIEPGSVIVQRLYFKATHGRRIFLMSPIHHHFELKGWAEVTVVVRFWVIGGLLSALGVGLFYLEWLTRAR